MRENVTKPKDQVIQYIRQSLMNGTLKPDTKLPAERTLAQMFAISRAAVREALKTLENFGIIKTRPQSGSVIVGLDLQALDGLLSDLLRLDAADFASVLETRVILEVSAARFCAIRRTNEDIEEMQVALDHYTKLYTDPSATIEERVTADFAYHRTIAHGAKNAILKSMLMFITPEIITTYNREKISHITKNEATVLQEHHQLLEAIKARDFERSQEIMYTHLAAVIAYAKKLRERVAREVASRHLKQE